MPPTYRVLRELEELRLAQDLVTAAAALAWKALLSFRAHAGSVIHT